jgi:hypothetical protein
MIQMINTLQGLKATVRASGGASPEEFLNQVVQGYSPDVATAYALLKSYTEAPPIFAPRTEGSVFNEVYINHRVDGGRTAMDRLLGLVAASSVTVARGFDVIDSSAFQSFEDIRDCYWLHDIGFGTRWTILDGLQSSGRESMSTLWSRYNGISVRTKNRSSWTGSDELYPVMKCRDLAAIGVSEDFIWRVDQQKYRRWQDARNALRVERKLLPQFIDGRWIPY